jgi:hypothetical protein
VVVWISYSVGAKSLCCLLQDHGQARKLLKLGSWNLPSIVTEKLKYGLLFPDKPQTNLPRKDYSDSYTIFGVPAGQIDKREIISSWIRLNSALLTRQAKEEKKTQNSSNWKIQSSGWVQTTCPKLGFVLEYLSIAFSALQTSFSIPQVAWTFLKIQVMSLPASQPI